MRTMSVEESTAIPEVVVWELGGRKTATTNTKVGIAGDFFPAMRLNEPDEQAWLNRAQLLEPYFRDLDVAIVIWKLRWTRANSHIAPRTGEAKPSRGIRMR